MPRLSKIGAAALAAFGWTSGSAVSASYLVIAGGGGAGGSGTSYSAGGGGAGGLLTGTASLNPTLTYTVTVGAGGAGGIKSNTSAAKGLNGSNSQFGSLTASVGGGGGAGQDGGSTSPNSGGSGGGGLAGSSGGAATSGQGFAGGSNLGSRAGAGGGGAGAVGVDNPNNGYAQPVAGTAGGIGVSSSISGTSTYYAGGGGGGGVTSGAAGGAGGNGGGGAGANGTNTNGTSGTANLGGGGGGAGTAASIAGDGANGGNGGSGIVIISYVGAQQFSGGVVTSSGGNTIHTFTTSGTLGPVTPLSANYLVVAGGGAGGGAGGYVGGGGGAGGLLSGSGLTIDPYSTYLVTVGAGGAGATTALGISGTNSTFSMVATAAVGGGGGGATSGTNGANGGSGGGCGYSGGAAGTGTSGQGNNGAAGSGIGFGTGGGGGGASAAGIAGGASLGGAGGAGTASSITGSSVTYAGGGAGAAGAGGTGGTGGAGGGGNGANGSVNASTSGTANLGSGGGAANASFTTSGSGGSGVVIISYAGSTQLMAGGVVTIAGGNVIHTFNSSGYLTPLTLLTRSLRFRSSASAYLNRTPATAGNRTTWSWSGWVKRGKLGAYQTLFSTYGNSTNVDEQIRLYNSDVLNIEYYSTSSFVYQLLTTPVYRDPAAWYHIVVAMDTTQATASNRIKVYVNGTQVTSFSTATYPAQNTNTLVDGALPHYIGVDANNGLNAYFDGYMAEVNFIDGQALAPTAFGTFNSYGVWQPITYGGSYGTNGFRLPFTNNASTTTLGYDFSPQGNNWTTNNISVTAGSTYDSMTDVPTLTSATAANYCVFNPLLDWHTNGSNFTLSNGNLDVSEPAASTYGSVGTTIAMTTGKWYCEITASAVGAAQYTSVGITATTSAAGYPGQTATSYAYRADALKINNASSVSYGATYTSGDVIAIAFDADAGSLIFYKNGTSQGTAFTGISAGAYYFVVGDFASTQSSAFSGNFGQRPFAYTPPTGYLALNTFNL